MKAKHFIIYYAKGTGTFIVTEPRPWARDNKNKFPHFDFINNHPTTIEVENYLIQNHGFQRVNTNCADIIAIQNLDVTLTM
jgi:hypothetical protein